MRKGFTLIELIIVITILEIMATLIIFNNVTASLRSGRDSKRKQDLSKLTQVMEDYYNDNYSYPPAGAGGTIDDIAWGGSFSTYVDRLPQDPRSPTQQYYYQTNENRNYYAIYAKLENSQDGDIAKVACQSGCGPGLAYNYVVHSTNIVMLAGLPQVPGSGGEVVPTPTEEPPTATPVVPTATPVVTYPVDEERINCTSAGTVVNTISCGPISAGTNKLILVSVIERGGLGMRVSSISGLGMSFTQRKEQCSANGTQTIELWSAYGNPTAGSVTLNFTNSNYVVVFVDKFTNVNPLVPYENPAGANTNGQDSTNCSSGPSTVNTNLNLSSTVNNTLIHVVTGSKSQFITVADPDYNQLAYVTAGISGNFINSYLHQRNLATAGNDNISHQLNSSIAAWVMAGLVIRP